MRAIPITENALLKARKTDVIKEDSARRSLISSPVHRWGEGVFIFCAWEAGPGEAAVLAGWPEPGIGASAWLIFTSAVGGGDGI
jgi:hypothetical protein